MTTLYITKLPENPGMSTVYSLREALQALDSPHVGFADAQAVLEHCSNPEHLPHVIARTDDEGAIKRARTVLAEAGVTCAVNLPHAALQPPPDPEPPAAQPVSYNAARIALVAMQLADGNPAMALHHCVLLANAAGEVEGERGTCMEAAAVLLDTFPPGLMETIKATIHYYTGIEPEEEEA